MHTYQKREKLQWEQKMKLLSTAAAATKTRNHNIAIMVTIYPNMALKGEQSLLKERLTSDPDFEKEN